MASISKPKNSKNWIIQFYYDDKKYCKSTRTSTKRGALRVKLLVEQQLAEGTFDPSSMLKRPSGKIKLLSDLVKKWKAYNQKRGDITPGAAYQYEAVADKMLEIAGDMLVKNITPVYVKDEFLLELDNLYTPRTVRSKMTSLRAMFSYAERNNFIEKNPFKGNVPSYQRMKPVFFREEEIKVYKDY